MALKRREALGLALVMVLLLVAILPPRSCSEVDRWSLTAMALCGGTRVAWTRGYDYSLDRARNALRRRVGEIRIADSLSALAGAGRGVRSSDGSVVVLHEAPLSADSARHWLALAIAERERIAGGTPRARIVVALESSPARARREHELERQRVYGLAPRARRFIVASGRDTTCFVTLRLGLRGYDAELVETDGRGAYGAFLGSCGLVGRFGVPGARVARAARYAFLNDRSSYYQRRSTVVRTETDDARSAPSYYALIGCMKGQSDACAALVNFGDAGSSYGQGMNFDMRFLSYIWLTEGPEKFQRFWQSPLSADRALEEAFGRPTAQLVRAWVQHDFRMPYDNDRSVGDMALAAVGWLGAALAAAIAVGMYRQAGA